MNILLDKSLHTSKYSVRIARDESSREANIEWQSHEPPRSYPGACFHRNPGKGVRWDEWLYLMRINICDSILVICTDSLMALKPNPPFSTVGGNRSTQRKPTTFGRALTMLFSHEDWVWVHIKINLTGNWTWNLRGERQVVWPLHHRSPTNEYQGARAHSPLELGNRISNLLAQVFELFWIAEIWFLQ